MSASDERYLPCTWCRRAVPPGSEKCPYCGREPRPADVAPMGDASAESDPSPVPEAPPRLPSAGETLKERRAGRAARERELAQLGSLGYLRLLVSQDQVLGVLLALLAAQAIMSTAALATSAQEGRLPVVRALLCLFQWATFAGVLTLQRWAHTVVIWAAGVTLLLSFYGALRLLQAPMYVDSGALLLWYWLQWIFSIVIAAFVLIVLSERSAYFGDGFHRVDPKRRLLADYFRRGYWRKLNAPRRGEEQADVPASSAPLPLRRRPRYQVDPLPPAPGQRAGTDWAGVRETTRWANITAQAREDRLFGGLLIALAVQTLLVVAQLNALAILGAVAVLWGVLSQQQMGYWLGLLASVALALLHGAALFAAARQDIPAVALIFPSCVMALNVFIVGALVSRRDRFQ
jgi:hypothetical protein